MNLPRLSRRGIIAGVFLALVLVASIWYAARTINRHDLAMGSIPVRPALGTWPAEFVDRIAAGEAAAAGYFEPGKGLAVLSRLYYANGFYHEALQCYAGLQELEPAEARWAHLSAGILTVFGRLEEARPLVERAVELAPDYIPARLRLGEVRLKSNLIAPAEESYAGVLKREAGNPFALLGLAKVSLVRGDWAKAREHLEEAARLHPDFIGGLSLLVTVREHFDDKLGADALRERIGKREFTDFADPWRDELSDDCYDAYLLSVAAAKANFSGDTATARRWMERACELAPTVGTYPRQLARMLLEKRDFAPARQHLEKAVALNPGDSDAWGLMVLMYEAMGETQGAMRSLINGLANCPQSAALHYTYGQRLNQAGRPLEAIRELKTSQRLRPNEANAYIDLAMIYFTQERPESAVAELKGALVVQPGHPVALEVLARYAINTGDETAARGLVSQLRLQPRVPPADLKLITDEFQQRFHSPP